MHPGLIHRSGLNQSKNCRFSLVGIIHKIENPYIRPWVPNFQFKGQTPEQYYHELFDTYQSLEEPVMKADMFRYLIVYHFGGLYADLDTEALKSFDGLLKGNSKMIIGVELEFDNTMLLKMAPVYNNFYKKNNLNKQYIQYCFLSEAKNPLLLEIAKEIARDKHKVFDSIKHANTIIKTGPGIL